MWSVVFEVNLSPSQIFGVILFPMRSLEFSIDLTSSDSLSLGLTQPLTEMSTRNFSGVKGGQPESKADNFTANFELLGWIMWEPRCLTTLLASRACYNFSFIF
jgi:hypothetical protein